jgi:hypothetical protein
MKFILLLLGIVLSMQLFSQEAEIQEEYYNPVFSQEVEKEISKTGLLNKDRFDFDMTAGASYTASKYGSYFSNYFSPKVNYEATDDFTLSVGAGVMVNPMVISNNGESIGNYGGTYSYFYAQGAYKLNENLSVHGTVYKGTSLTKSTDQPYEFKGASFGAEYKFDNNMSVGIDINVSDKPSPFNYGFGNPAGFYSPFSPMPGW